MKHNLGLLGALVLLVGMAHLLVHLQYTMDDAYITFRYSANLAGGLGLVHNPGQYVKGYSNTSWTVLMAVPELLGYCPLYFSKAIGLACFVVTFMVMLAYSRDSSVTTSGTTTLPLSDGWESDPRSLTSWPAGSCCG